jgi:hypothetical protein
MKGTALRTVAEVLGHKDLRMTMNYSHLSANHIADAVALLDDVFGLLPSPQDVPAEVAPTQALTVTASK